MKRRERTPAFYVYTFAIGVLILMPWIAYGLTWALSKMDTFDKYAVFVSIALVALAYEYSHTFDPK